MGVSFAPVLRRRGLFAGTHDLDRLHPPGVLVAEDVAVEDKVAGEVVERVANYDAAPVLRDVDDVLAAVSLVGLAVDAHHLKVVDVDVEGVILVCFVDQGPLFDGAQNRSDVGLGGVELFAVDQGGEFGTGAEGEDELALARSWLSGSTVR